MPTCTNCDSTNVKKSSAVNEQGRSTSSGTAGGLGISSSGTIGAYRGAHHSERISAVAEKNAPPTIDATKIGCIALSAVPVMMLLGVAANGFAGLVVMGLLSIVVSVVIVVVMLLMGPSDAQRAADERYAKQWYCMTCGEMFFLGGRPSGTQASQTDGIGTRSAPPETGDPLPEAGSSSTECGDRRGWWQRTFGM